jgi:hypothetical protein
MIATTPERDGARRRLARLAADHVLASVKAVQAEATREFVDRVAGMVIFHHLDHDRQRALCCHEAGHVVMDLALGLPFDSVSVQPRGSEDALGIVRGGKALPMRTDADAVQACFALLAGGVAEEIAAGRRNLPAEADDLRQAHRVLLAAAPGLSAHQRVDLLQDLRPGVKAVLEERWDEVQALARALFRHGELSASEARAIAADARLAARARQACAELDALTAAWRRQRAVWP